MKIDIERDTVNGAANAFSIMQPDAGTAPVADSGTDTLTFTSADGTILITGNSTTDTLDFAVVASLIDHDALLNFAANEHFTEASIDHVNILSVGANTHAQIDTHLGSTSNPHTVSLEQARTADNAFSGAVLLADGTVSLPSLAFADTNNGMYYIGTDQYGFSAGGIKGLEVRKATGSYANIGMGGAASVSNAFPLLIERNVNGVATVQIANPDATATSAARFEMKASTGSSIAFELTQWHGGYVFVDAYSTGRATLRQSGGGDGISIIGGDAGDTIRLYAGGVGVGDRIIEAHPNYFETYKGHRRATNSLTTTSTTIDLTYDIVFLDASSNAVTCVLPTAVGNTGTTYDLICIDSTNTVTIDGNGSETISTDTTVTLVQGEAIQIVSDGSNWWVK